MNKELKLLGYEVKDRITNQKGIITSISYDLYGCIQGLVVYTYKKDGILVTESKWFDTNRFEVISKKPVMECRHTFEKNDLGGQDLPNKGE